MSRLSKIESVLSDLRRLGYNIEQSGDGYLVYYQTCRSYKNSDYYSKRELYRFHNSTINKGRGYKKIVKNLSNGQDRAATRDLIGKGEFDDIPSSHRTKEEDPWAWD